MKLVTCSVILILLICCIFWHQAETTKMPGRSHSKSNKGLNHRSGSKGSKGSSGSSGSRGSKDTKGPKVSKGKSSHDQTQGGKTWAEMASKSANKPDTAKKQQNTKVQAWGGIAKQNAGQQYPYIKGNNCVAVHGVPAKCGKHIIDVNVKDKDRKTKVIKITPHYDWCYNGKGVNDWDYCADPCPHPAFERKHVCEGCEDRELALEFTVLERGEPSYNNKGNIQLVRPGKLIETGKQQHLAYNTVFYSEGRKIQYTHDKFLCTIEEAVQAWECTMYPIDANKLEWRGCPDKGMCKHVQHTILMGHFETDSLKGNCRK